MDSKVKQALIGLLVVAAATAILFHKDIKLTYQRSSAQVVSANYPLQITQPQPNLNTNSRYYKAYPGIEYKVPIGVFGGVYPFTYSIVSGPAGMTINSEGILTWPSPTTAGSPHNVNVRVTDAAGTQATRAWTITVTTSGFIFVDANNGTHAQGWGCTSNCGTGTLTNPFRSMMDVFQGNTDPQWRNTTFDNQFIYWRAGTYGLEGFFEGTGQQYSMEWRGNYKPHVWLAYPGETVVIDHNLSSGSNGAFLDWRDGDSVDAYIQGITFRDMLNHAFRMGGGDRTVFFENRFENLGPGLDSHNSSYIMYASLSPNTYHFVKDNVFVNGTGHGAYIKTYTTRYLVVEGNSMTIGTGNNFEGVALKAGDQYSDVRANTIDGEYIGGSIGGNWADGGNYEIRYNNIKNGISTYGYRSGLGGAIMMDFHGSLLGNVYVYRNTFEGTATFRFGTGTGQIFFSNNVLVNQDSGTPAGSHISHYEVSNPSMLVLNNNLVGYAADNIIDSNGNLTAAYSQYVGSRGHQLTSGTPNPPPPAPTPTPPPTLDRTINLSALQGPTNKTVSGTLLVYNASRTQLASVPFTTNSSGTANVSLNLTAQTVTLKTVIPKYLNKTLTNVNLSNTSAYTFAAVRIGDLNADNIVNSVDFSQMNASWFQNNPARDLNSDGIINTVDFSLMNTNWFVQGDVE